MPQPDASFYYRLAHLLHVPAELTKANLQGPFGLQYQEDGLRHQALLQVIYDMWQDVCRPYPAPLGLQFLCQVQQQIPHYDVQHKAAV